MKQIVSPVIMNGSARKFCFNDVKGYKKDVEFTRNGDMTFTIVKYTAFIALCTAFV